MYITRGVYSSTPFTDCTAVARASESELGLSDAARGLVYSRASDDNVHAALNLPLLPPSSRELGRCGSPFPPFFSSFLFTFALYHIPFLPSYVPECCVALRSALLAFFRHHHFLSLLLRLCRPSTSFSVSLLVLYTRRCLLSARGESITLATQTATGMRRHGERMFMY